MLTDTRWHSQEKNPPLVPWPRESGGLPKQTSPWGNHSVVRPCYLHEVNSPLVLPRATRPSTLKGCVGTLKDGYVCNVPLPRVPCEQRASPKLTAPKDRIQLPGYSRLPAWIPMLPKLGNVLRFSQRLLWPFSPDIAIIAKNNLLSY